MFTYDEALRTFWFNQVRAMIRRRLRLRLRARRRRRRRRRLRLTVRSFWCNQDSLESDREFELIGILLGVAIYNG